MCKRELPATTEYFSRRAEVKDGMRYSCKKCDSKHRKERRQKNPDKYRERCRRWYKKNIDQEHERMRLRREENPEKFREAARKWRKNNPQKRNETAKRWRNAKDSRRMNDSITSAIYKGLKGEKNGIHWEDLVGYAIDDLIRHLESQFTEGMSWANYGKHGWHVDHIIPQSVFNFTKPEHEDFKRCWALENLQPMWAKENIAKHCRIENAFQPSLTI